ncbi:MAG TPA: hypothetical protein PKV71_18125 [Calditrichia bacterium]|nr:hypothetical protein [Calditrichota bacterium]HQU74623.1 hypothetical protein [Calditrichia bacterium]HQV33809.1 hypothetical protein [Calditrichia bacterium]
MNAIRLLFIAFFSFLLLTPALAEDLGTRAQNAFKEHLNQASQAAKDAQTPQEKRQILNDAFKKLDNVMEKARSLPAATGQDLDAIRKFQESLTEKSDELNGRNGFSAVPDQQLNQFADYAVQDMEQAERYFTISLTTALLIIIILLLL